MNIIEAIKSGKPYRRISWSLDFWVPVEREDLTMQVTRSDLIADDWEVQKTVTITAEKLEIAFNKVLRPEVLSGSFYDILEELKKELGI